MAISEEFREYILERLECFGPVVARKMFGSLEFYLSGVHFALASRNVLYFKVDDSNRPDYKAAGMEPFKPFGEKSYSMSYYEVPSEILDDDQALREWAFKAYKAAIRVNAAYLIKKNRKKKK